MEIVTSEEMRRIDRYAIRTLKIPSLRLMEEAGLRVAEVVRSIARRGLRLPDSGSRETADPGAAGSSRSLPRTVPRKGVAGGSPAHGDLREAPSGGSDGASRRVRVLVLCGKGNNGGDGLVAARHLHGAGFAVNVVLTADPDSLTGDALVNLTEARKAGLDPEIASTPSAWKRISKTIPDFDLIVDALLGTGLTGAARGLAATIIQDLEDLNPDRADSAAHRGETRRRSSTRTGSGARSRDSRGGEAPVIVAVDIPSGLSGDSSEVPGPAVRADSTMALCRPKLAHLLPPACLRAGRVEIGDIGIPQRAVASVKPRIFTIDRKELAGFPPPRPRDAHKGSFGHALVVAGSVGKAGAAALASRAALRAGAGLATVATPAAVRPEVATFSPEVMTAAIPEGSVHETLEWLLAESAGKSAIALGPGLGRSPDVEAWIRGFVRACRAPLVLDADGLNAFAGHASQLSGRRRTLVLTPHPGEMSRLIGMDTERVLHDRIGLSRGLARKTGAIVVLKGMATVIASPDGRVYVNGTGNPGMATGGTGDVLTGLLAGLLAQRLDALRSVIFGVHVHGLAGDLAARALGEQALMAGDLLDRLPAALRELAG